MHRKETENRGKTTTKQRFYFINKSANLIIKFTVTNSDEMTTFSNS